MADIRVKITRRDCRESQTIFHMTCKHDCEIACAMQEALLEYDMRDVHAITFIREKLLDFKPGIS